MGWVEDLLNQAKRAADRTTDRAAASKDDKVRGWPNDPSWGRRPQDGVDRNGVKTYPVSDEQINQLGDWAMSALETALASRDPSVIAAAAKAALTGLAKLDMEYEDTGGESFDSFNFDINAEVTDYQYRHTLLREDENSVLVGQPGMAGNADAQGRRRTNKGVTTVHDLMVKTKNMSAGELEEFQRDLYAAGLYGPVSGERGSEPLWGAPDEPTLAAVKLLGYHTMSFKGKYSIVEMLDVFRNAADKDGDGTPDSAAKEKPKVRLTNPLDVQMTAQDKSVDLMGRRLGTDEAVGIASGYNGLEAAAGAAAGDGTGGGTYSDAPSAASFTENELREDYGAEIDAYGYLQTFNELLRELGVR